MCGIAGGVGTSAPRIEELDRALDAIHHRGPDERGTFLQSNIALGICRLSIIDVGTGQQPVSNEAETIQLVFNGEIYNFQALRQLLVSRVIDLDLMAIPKYWCIYMKNLGWILYNR